MSELIVLITGSIFVGYGAYKLEFSNLRTVFYGFIWAIIHSLIFRG